MSKVEEKGQDNDSDFESCGSDESIDIALEVQESIRQMENLEDKVQAIAINHYLIQKRELDKKKEEEKIRLQFKMRNSYNYLVDEIYAIVDGTSQLSMADLDFVLQNKSLLKEGELQIVEKIQKGQKNVGELNGEINQYWLKCLLNSEIIAEQIQETDKEVLKNLYRIEATKNDDNTKLTVIFMFKPNKWFCNEKISKTFKINKKDEAQKSQGDEIQWKEGMNYTVTIKGKKGKKNKKEKKEEVIREPSFFHFFTSISSNHEQNDKIKDEEEWDELMQDLELQYELSVHIYQDLIPKSLEYYLGCQPDEEQPKEPIKLDTIKEAVKKEEGSEDQN